MDLKIGDLIQCRDTHYNRALQIAGKIGMAAELRRRDVRILFDVDNQSIWLSKNAVNRITLPGTDSPTLLDRLAWLIRFVHAEECELELDEEGDYRYTVVCGELNLESLHAVRDYLTPFIIGMKVLPRGMARLALEVVFRRESKLS
jgi:hypothetical protein